MHPTATHSRMATLRRARWTGRLLAASGCAAIVLATLGLGGMASARADEPSFVPQVALEADVPNQLVGDVTKLTATASYLPLGYELRIFDTTGKELESCDTTTCPAAVVKNKAMTRTYRAFVANESGYPPPGMAASELVSVTWSTGLVLTATRRTSPRERRSS
jgi:hypothetical protein